MANVGNSENSLTGTCYTSRECENLNGISAGSCASGKFVRNSKQNLCSIFLGFGVCCVMLHSCGETANVNNTYFVNPMYPSPFNNIGQCMITLEKSSPDICQYRLDFLEFELRQPDEMTHLCTDDRMLVSGGSPVPTICGSNQGGHSK